MRDLNECQAEVFRRSEKRIKERKQRRNHILMACIPPVLCISLFSASIFAGHSDKTAAPENNRATEAVMGGLAEDTYESLTCSIAKIEVSGFGISLSYTEPSDVLLISDQLNAYSVVEPENSGSTNEETRDEDFTENAVGDYGVIMDITSGTGNGYTITLTMHEGTCTEYYLIGNTLKNQTTHQTCTLSQKQVNELKEVLGIPHR